MLSLIALKALLAFAISTFMTWAELVTSRYPRTIKLFWNRSSALWVYPAIYGLISLGFTAAYGPLHDAGILQVSILGGSSAPLVTDARVETSATPSWWVAIMLGLSAKALLHISLFSVPGTGTQQSFPVGTESIVQLFEPWLLRTIAIDEFNAVSVYLQAKADHYPDLLAVKQKIKDNLPGKESFPEAERTALELDVDRANTVRAALEIYLRALGVATLEQQFPGVPGSSTTPSQPQGN